MMTFPVRGAINDNVPSDIHGVVLSSHNCIASIILTSVVIWVTVLDITILPAVPVCIVSMLERMV